jgi:hypothetical protein
MAGISGGNVSPILSGRVPAGTNSFAVAFRPHPPTAQPTAGGHGVVMKWGCDSNPGQLQIDVKRAISGFAAVAERVYRKMAGADQDTDLTTPWRAATDSRKVREQCARTPSFSSVRLRVWV